MATLAERIRGRWLRFLYSLPGAKERTEMAFWKGKQRAEGTLKNDHYQFLYTGHWNLEPSFYEGKKILDIGCGPRGSLEWADMAAERVGIDSLAAAYRKLGTDKHKMTYAACGIEDAPYEEGHFDVITSVNSLDHVDDLDRAIVQIKRLTKPGGLFLLLVEVNHEPTVCEPFTLTWDTVKQFEPEFEPVLVRHYESCRQMIESLQGPEYNHDDPTPRVGMLSAMFRRK